MLVALAATLLTAPCRAKTDVDAAALVQRSISAVGLNTIGSSIRTSSVTDVFTMAFQSDRMYPPYLWAPTERRIAADWERGLYRIEQGAVSYLTDSSRVAAVSSRGAMIVDSRAMSLVDERAFDPWMVLASWRAASDAKVAEECFYRDYWRTVLTRRTQDGIERLFIDPKTAVPVKLERREPHYLWGDVLAEYHWEIWAPVKGTSALAPQFLFRMVDGEVDQQRTTNEYAIQSRDSAGVLTIPEGATMAPSMSMTEPDTVRVAPNTFLLRTRAYTNVVTLERDTVFVLDAQTSAERARRDSLWLGKLFPGRHPVVLVVTDLAWPHIAGVRYWVANGATVVSHPASRDFLKRVVDRKWTLAPDLLEQRRGRARFTFKPVDGQLDLAGGAVRLRPIDGIGSEGALMAFLPGASFLYAGDYIQGGGPTSFSATYAREVAAAVRRAGFSPEKFAAMHVGLTDWKTLSRFTGQP